MNLSSKKETNYSQLYQKELKTLAKKFKLPVSGTKKVLIGRITLFLELKKSATIIQKCVRSFFCRQLYKIILRSYKKECVNLTDFYTLEPLKDISFYSLFVYCDKSNFTYGFNIESLIQLYIKTGKILNPYNRNKISIEVMFDIFTMYSLMRIIYKKNSNVCLRLPNNFTFRVMNVNGEYLRDDEVVNRVIPEIEFSQNRQNIIVTYSSNIDYSDYGNDNVIMQLLTLQQRTSTNLLIMKETLRNIRATIDIFRQESVNNRINEIFMEIDQLGHYTNCEWLLSLNASKLKSFLISLQEIWDYRTGIIDRVKFRIYPFGDPFENIEFNNNSSKVELLNNCVTVIENFVLSAPDIDDRKLATLFVLSALTRASLTARTQLYWLYESIDWDSDRI